jgi:hypothetical protein
MSTGIISPLYSSHFKPRSNFRTDRLAVGISLLPRDNRSRVERRAIRLQRDAMRHRKTFIKMNQ